MLSQWARLVVGVVCGCVAVALTSACTAIRVQECANEGCSKAKTLPGLPFFAKKGEWVRSTAYVQQWLDVELILKQRSGTEWVVMTSLSTRVAPAPRAPLDALRLAVGDLNKTGDPTALDKVWKAFHQLPSAAQGGPVPSTPFSDKLEQRAVVDYSKRLYLNAKAPLFSKATLSQELSADGSLAEVTGEIDTTGMAGGLAGLLPLKEFLTAKYVPDAEVTTTEAALLARADYRFELEINPGGELTTYRQIKGIPGSPPKTLPYGCTLCDVARAPLGQATKSEPSKNTIAVKGEIRLPGEGK